MNERYVMMDETPFAALSRATPLARLGRGVTFALVVVLLASTSLGCRSRSRSKPTGREADPVPAAGPVVTPPSPLNTPSPTGSRSFSSSSKFVVPSGVRSVRIEVTAGGGGGGASCNARRNGGTSGLGTRQVGTFPVTPGDILDVNMVTAERGRCGGGNGGRGGSAAVRGSGIDIFANGGFGGIGTNGGCGFCGGDGGPSTARISW